MKLDFYLTRIRKINLKWFKDIHIRPVTQKPLEKQGGNCDICINNDFLAVTLKV
jgi:hypothetical protein